MYNKIMVLVPYRGLIYFNGTAARGNVFNIKFSSPTGDLFILIDNVVSTRHSPTVLVPYRGLIYFNGRYFMSKKVNFGSSRPLPGTYLF